MQAYFSKYKPYLCFQEWGTDCPHEYLGSYRLEYDQSWTAEDRIEERNSDQQVINKILTCSNALSITMGK